MEAIEDNPAGPAEVTIFPIPGSEGERFSWVHLLISRGMDQGGLSVGLYSRSKSHVIYTLYLGHSLFLSE